MLKRERRGKPGNLRFSSSVLGIKGGQCGLGIESAPLSATEPTGADDLDGFGFRPPFSTALIAAWRRTCSSWATRSRAFQEASDVPSSAIVDLTVFEAIFANQFFVLKVRRDSWPRRMHDSWPPRDSQCDQMLFLRIAQKIAKIARPKNGFLLRTTPVKKRARPFSYLSFTFEIDDYQFSRS